MLTEANIMPSLYYVYYVSPQVYTYVFMYISIYVCMYMCMYMRMYILMYAFTYPYVTLNTDKQPTKLETVKLS